MASRPRRVCERSVKSVPTILCLCLATAAGCADGAFDPAARDGLAPPPAASAAPASLQSDMITPADMDVTTVRGALTGGGSGTEPRVFYLRYADGTETHTANYDACTGAVPKFECSFAPTLVECQRQIQAYLDEWYKDFNIIFTLTRPTSGKYYTEVVSSGGGRWCMAD